AAAARPALVQEDSSHQPGWEIGLPKSTTFCSLDLFAPAVVSAHVKEPSVSLPMPTPGPAVPAVLAQPEPLVELARRDDPEAGFHTGQRGRADRRGDVAALGFARSARMPRAACPATRRGPTAWSGSGRSAPG